MKGTAQLTGIVGQDRAVRSLLGVLNSGRLHHAYLFCGPRGVGKRTAAMAFSAAALCRSPSLDGDSCGSCPSCLKIPGGNHPDLHIVATPERVEQSGIVGHVVMGEEAGEKRTGSQSDRRMIKIDQVRELERYMGEMPFESPRKVALVLDAEMMNIQSQNAMLKTLEEPPGESLIVLTTAAPSSLPLTVLSRCLRILFPPLGEDAVASMLRAGGADPAQTEMLAHLSGGSAGRAAAIGGGVAWVLESIAGMSCVPGGTASWALELAAELGRGGRDRSDNVTRLLDLLDAFGIFLRDSAAGDFGSRWGMVPGLKTVAPDTATRCFPALDGARRALELHCNAQLVLESLFMKMREAASPGGE